MLHNDILKLRLRFRRYLRNLLSQLKLQNKNVEFCVNIATILTQTVDSSSSHCCTELHVVPLKAFAVVYMSPSNNEVMVCGSRLDVPETQQLLILTKPEKDRNAPQVRTSRAGKVPG